MKMAMFTVGRSGLACAYWAHQVIGVQGKEDADHGETHAILLLEGGKYEFVRETPAVCVERLEAARNWRPQS